MEGRARAVATADQVVTLDLKAEDEVADIGAGSGYFTMRLAKSIGPSGKVYAVDIDRKLLDYVEARAEREKLDNIQTVLCVEDDPRLGSASVDMIFICDTLHHIQNRPRYYKLLLRALRPGGASSSWTFTNAASCRASSRDEDRQEGLHQGNRGSGVSLG
jgi:ubiquinone/menaquinone biosynthesis C-methylase UbiE